MPWPNLNKIIPLDSKFEKRKSQNRACLSWTAILYCSINIVFPGLCVWCVWQNVLKFISTKLVLTLPLWPSALMAPAAIWVNGCSEYPLPRQSIFVASRCTYKNVTGAFISLRLMAPSWTIDTRLILFLWACRLLSVNLIGTCVIGHKHYTLDLHV